jgi:DNA repair exonuclease SbcCD ATPase subunit
MRAIGFLIVLTIVGFGIYMVVSPSNPRGPSGEDVKQETSEALSTAKDFTKGKAEQLKEDTKENYHAAKENLEETAENVKEATKENYHAAKKNIKQAFSSDFGYDQRENYRQELENQLEEWEQKCHELENKLIQEGKKQEYYSQIQSIKDVQQTLRSKINELSSVTAEKWDDFQDEVSEKMSSLESSFNELQDKAARTGR